MELRLGVLHPGVGVMDSVSLQQRAAHCRFLAEKLTRSSTLLDLPAKYEASFPKQPSQISINPTAQVVPLAIPRNQ
jgi:hypothetical protein